MDFFVCHDLLRGFVTAPLEFLIENLPRRGLLGSCGVRSEFLGVYVEGCNMYVRAYTVGTRT